MPYVYDSPENVDIATTTTQSTDRAGCLRVYFDIETSQVDVRVERGDDDGAGGITRYGPVIKHTFVFDESTTEDPFDTIMDTVTTDAETLGEAIERIILDKLNTDGLLPDGSIQ